MITVWLIAVTLLHLVSSTQLPLVPTFDITVPDAPAGQCRTDGDLLASATKNSSLWAMKMWDATAVGSSNVLQGNTWQLGSFGECLKAGGPFQTQYCVVLVYTNLTHIGGDDAAWRFVEETVANRHYLRRDLQHVGVCLPASCSPNELQQSLSTQVNKVSDASYRVVVSPKLCTSQQDRKKPWTPSEIVFGTFVGFLVLCCTLGTFIGLLPMGNNLLSKILRCFSVPTNLKKLMQVDPNASEHPLAVLHGIKVISMAINVFGHRALFFKSGVIANYSHIEDNMDAIEARMMTQIELVCDTFFFVSGVLTTFFLCKEVSKKRYRPGLTFIGRFIRLAPAYYALVWFQATVAHRVASGPIWKRTMTDASEPCQNYWWASVLFIHNYMPGYKLCMFHTWYLGCDLHFFLLGLLLIPLLVVRPRLGKAALYLGIFVTSLFPAVMVYVYALDPSLLFFSSVITSLRHSSAVDVIYTPSHMRVTTYLIGTAVGYFLVQKDSSTYIMPKARSIWLAIVGLFLIFFAGLSGVIFYTKYSPGLALTALITWYRRPCWVLGLTALLIAHRFSKKNGISKFLSGSIMVVLSKLTYTMYIVQFPLIWYDFSKLRIPKETGLYDVFKEFFGDMSYTTLVAMNVFILLESPLRRIMYEVVFARKQIPTKELKEVMMPMQATDNNTFVARL